MTNSLLALGFMLVMVVPCSSMSIGYTGLSKGNVQLATVSVALSFVLAVVAVPLWMRGFAARYRAPIPLQDMITSILTVLIAPMLLGYLTRLGLVRWLGHERFQRIHPLFPALSLLAIYGIVFLIFFSKASMIADKWQTVLLLLVPNAIFIALTLAVVTWVNKRVGLWYCDNMAVVFASTGKNNGTAIAIATMAFSPLVDSGGNDAHLSDPAYGLLPEDGGQTARVFRERAWTGRAVEHPKGRKATERV